MDLSAYWRSHAPYFQETWPLGSYKWMHKNARLTKDEKELIVTWVKESKDSLSVKN
jgi:hypothetical protein